MSAAHTPGPWAAYTPTTKSGRHYLTLKRNGRRLCDLRVGLDDATRDAVHALVCEANAAPDLLAALRSALSVLADVVSEVDSTADGGDISNATYSAAICARESARAAIAAAEGK